MSGILETLKFLDVTWLHVAVAVDKQLETQAARIAALEAAVTQCRTLSAMLKPQADRIAELEAALLNLIEHTLDCEIELNKLHGLGAGTSSVLCEAHAALEGGKK